MIAYIKAKGGRLILSSDAHSKENIAYKFEEYEPLLK
jgi:histidinol phosphatase-like PHP family hydrolase